MKRGLADLEEVAFQISMDLPIPVDIKTGRVDNTRYRHVVTYSSRFCVADTLLSIFLWRFFCACALFRQQYFYFFVSNSSFSKIVTCSPNYVLEVT